MHLICQNNVEKGKEVFERIVLDEINRGERFLAKFMDAVLDEGQWVSWERGWDELNRVLREISASGSARDRAYLSFHQCATMLAAVGKRPEESQHHSEETLRFAIRLFHLRPFPQALVWCQRVELILAADWYRYEFERAEVETLRRVHDLSKRLSDFPAFGHISSRWEVSCGHSWLMNAFPDIDLRGRHQIVSDLISVYITCFQFVLFVEGRDRRDVDHLLLGFLWSNRTSVTRLYDAVTVQIRDAMEQTAPTTWEDLAKLASDYRDVVDEMFRRGASDSCMQRLGKTVSKLQVLR